MNNCLVLYCFLSLSAGLFAQTGDVLAFAAPSFGISVIDVKSMTVVGSINNAGGYRMVYCKNNDRIYSTSGGVSLYISDAQTQTLIQAVNPSTVNVNSSELEGIAISPDGSKVYVVDESTNGLFVWDTAADILLNAVPLNLDEPEDVVVSPDGAFLYLNDNSDVSKISTQSLTVVASLFVGNDGHGVTISNDGSTVYADGAGIEVINTNTMSLNTSLAGSGYFLHTNMDGSRVYGVMEGNQLSVVDATVDTLIANVSLSVWLSRGIDTYANGDSILVATSNGLIKLDALTLSEQTVLPGNFRSVVVRSPGQVGINDDSDNGIPSTNILLQNYPNPFNPETVIRYQLPAISDIHLSIFNILGQQIRTLVKEKKQEGFHQVTWNGLDDAGYPAPSGVYFYRMTSGKGNVQSKKMLLVR